MRPPVNYTIANRASLVCASANNLLHQPVTMPCYSIATVRDKNTHTHVYIYIYTYIHTYTRTHVRTYIHTYIQAVRPGPSSAAWSRWRSLCSEPRARPTAGRTAAAPGPGPAAAAPKPHESVSVSGSCFSFLRANEIRGSKLARIELRTDVAHKLDLHILE